MLDPAIRGHVAVRTRLRQRMEDGRLAGSLLFVGPEGIGKRRVALELAQRELCFRRTACGVCEGCRPFKNPEALPVELPNLLRIAPEGKAGLIRIGMIREDDLVEGGVIRWVHQAPPPRCHRWIVIEDAHRLNGASANMLLKTLEEPPEGAHFLLVTHRPEAVLQTIRSRCERVAFVPLDTQDAWDVALAAGWDPEDAPRWCALAGGSLRFLDPELFAQACAQVDAWVEALATGTARVAPFMPDRGSTRSQGEQLGQVLELLMRVLGDVVRLRLGRDPELAPWREGLARAAARVWDPRKVQEVALQLQRHLMRNPHAEIALGEVMAAI